MFGRKSGNEVKSSEQLHRFREEAERAKLSHGSEVLVQVPNMQQPVENHLKACYIRPFRVLKVVAVGDGKPLPEDVTIDESFRMPVGMSHFDPIVKITVNGTVRVSEPTEEELAEVAFAV